MRAAKPEKDSGSGPKNGPTIAYELHEYLILPHASPQKQWEGRPANRWTRAVLIFSKGASAWDGCYNEMTDKLYSYEADIPLLERYLCGLLALPTGKLVASPES
ncbi:hypothetical protein [Pseudomonas linyingensis]|uniref:hypothetical protein n=1 Tax=Pseudomonas linyingensis TaxID=915471 RepID=UPI00111345DA|nr:hypothetical protein [Pseudomonas linyingensis]